MTTTPTTQHPDVPLPAGTHATSDFDDMGGEYRIVFTGRRRVEATDALGLSVSCSAA